MRGGPVLQLTASVLLVSLAAVRHCMPAERLWPSLTLGLTDLGGLHPLEDFMQICGLLLPFCNETAHLVSLLFAPDDPLYDAEAQVTIGTVMDGRNTFKVAADILSLLGIIVNVIFEERKHGDVMQATFRGVGLALFSFTMPGLLIPDFVAEVDRLVAPGDLPGRAAATAAFLYTMDLAAIALAGVLQRLRVRLTRPGQTASDRTALFAYAAVALLVGTYSPALAAVALLYLCLFHRDRLLSAAPGTAEEAAAAAEGSAAEEASAAAEGSAAAKTAAAEDDSDDSDSEDDSDDQ